MVSMKRHLREYTTHLVRSLLFWTTALPLFAAFRYYGINYELGVVIDQEAARLYAMDNLFVSYAFVGALIGLFYATIEFWIDKYLNRHLPLALTVLINAVLVSIAVISCSFLTFKIFSNIYDAPYDISLGWWYQDKSFWAHFLYIPFASLVFSLLVIVTDNYGTGLFWKIVLGHYKSPKEENRIFMFLDMKDSTAIAEKIGHLKFSQLLQDCFYELNELAPLFKAEIYQYIGDEAVLTWPIQKSSSNQNCIKLFFEFQRKLALRALYYQERYRVKPVFKAGIHAGIVTATEVGVIKKELAFHGDVVNTSARIQGECNRYLETLLISKELLTLLGAAKSYLTKYVGKVLLKGKNAEVEIFAVSHTDK